MQQVDVEKLVFPRVSEHGLKVLEVLGGEDYSFDEVLKPLTMDPTLSALLLKYANSPLYRRQAEVSNLRTAVSVLGVKNVKLAVTVAAMRSIIARHTEASTAILEHSLAISALARLIAQKLPAMRGMVEDAELLGLIHDFPALVLAANFPDEYNKAFVEARSAGRDLDELQAEYFAIDTAQLLRWFGESMRLPESARESLCLLFGVTPEGEAFVPAVRQMEVLALAHWIDRRVRDDSIAIRQRLLVDQQTLSEALGLDDATIDGLADRYAELLAVGFSL